MYEIVQHQGDSPRYPLKYEETVTVKPFDKLKDAINYWKDHNLWGSDGYFLVLTAPEVPPTALRLDRGHFR